MFSWVMKPWPWYVAGPLIGLMVPLLLLIGNKSFGVSSSLRHICAACFPHRISFFKYNWKREAWNLFLVGGIVVGGIIASQLLTNPTAIQLNPKLVNELYSYGISDYSQLVPAEIFTWPSLVSLQGVILIIAGGFLVGFGTRYAGGCTSGHSIMGLSNLQLPSLFATICFLAGGFIVSNLVLPLVLNL